MQVAHAMKPHALKWGRLIYPLLVHGSPQVRADAVIAMETGMTHLQSHQAAIARELESDLKV